MGGKVKIIELLQNVVITNKRKMLRRLDQKVRSQMTCFNLGSHGYKAAGGQTEPNPSDKLSIRNVVSPYPSFVRKQAAARWADEVRVWERGKSESHPVMG